MKRASAPVHVEPVGADGFMEKPISLDTLLARVRREIGAPSDHRPPVAPWPGSGGHTVRHRFLRSSYGQGLVEYAVIIVWVAIAARVVRGTLGGTIRLLFTSVIGSFSDRAAKAS